ncbi:uncharacterized protein LOC111674371 [Orussus abietinus]|uniref:uncharacterized protein LOC111674371 n=1 Tax=Orussus abietinus TaxID=222816 RepID=UPI000C715F06|nr:uncharacterized protein LOC111674371 [Orussus abietinus]
MIKSRFSEDANDKSVVEISTCAIYQLEKSTSTDDDNEVYSKLEHDRIISELETKITSLVITCRLLRSESANANKGFLINNYKAQLAELTKEKEQEVSRCKELESENVLLRNSNAQLKGKISLLNSEKEKLALESEKSKSSVKERVETQALKYERSMQQEMSSVKAKCDQAVGIIKSKMNISESRNKEYHDGIKGFLAMVHGRDHKKKSEACPNGGETSDREVHEAACSILNITPGELSGFMNAGSSSTIKSWLTELQKVTSRSGFAEDLAKFLFEKSATVGEE